MLVEYPVTPEVVGFDGTKPKGSDLVWVGRNPSRVDEVLAPKGNTSLRVAVGKVPVFRL